MHYYCQGFIQDFLWGGGGGGGGGGPVGGEREHWPVVPSQMLLFVVGCIHF